jgi:peptide/nickel transport system permease protein
MVEVRVNPSSRIKFSDRIAKPSRTFRSVSPDFVSDLDGCGKREKPILQLLFYGHLMMRILYTLFRRTLQLVLLSFLLTLAAFLLSSWIPGDFYSAHDIDPAVRRETVDQLRLRYGLDQPIHVQYGRWLSNLLRLDLGHSLFYQMPVSDIVIDAILNTLWIGLPALLLGVPGGIVLGALHAIHRNSAVAHLFDLLSTLFLSLPSLVLGIAALLLASRTQWFPLGGMSSQYLEDPTVWAWLADRIHHLALPVTCLSLPILASIERIQCASASGCSEELYLRSARSRGLKRRRVFLQYLLRPSLNPIIAVSGPLFGAVLSGSLVLEVVFTWPGLGQITYNALFNNDLFLLVGCIVGSGILLVVGNLTADFLLMAVDPRTRRESGRAQA